MRSWKIRSAVFQFSPLLRLKSKRQLKEGAGPQCVIDVVFLGEFMQERFVRTSFRVENSRTWRKSFVSESAAYSQ